MQQTMPDQPAIREAELYGMPEPEIIGSCGGCDYGITTGEEYCEDSVNGDLMHDDAVCIANYYRKNVLIRR